MLGVARDAEAESHAGWSVSGYGIWICDEDVRGVGKDAGAVMEGYEGVVDEVKGCGRVASITCASQSWNASVTKRSASSMTYVTSRVNIQ